MISKAIESKTEPIKDFDEHSTLVERHHEFILARLLALGEKPAAIPELEGEPTAEQIEEHKLKCEEVAKEYQARCEKRDNWMKDAFEMPAYWVLEEKILMKYEVSPKIVSNVLCAVFARNFPILPRPDRLLFPSDDGGANIRKNNRRHSEHQHQIALQRDQLQEISTLWLFNLVERVRSQEEGHDRQDERIDGDVREFAHLC